MTRPVMFIIAGPNGAGKTTLYKTRIQPHTAAPFINADLIQRDELKDASMQSAYKAAQIAESLRRKHMAQKTSFVSESTFSHPSKLDLILDAKAAGYLVVLYHVNLRHSDLSVARVAQRVHDGGHNVPEDKIRERFARNPALIRQAMLKSDRGYVYDNSYLCKPPALVATFKNGQLVAMAEQAPDWAKNLYAKDAV